MHGSFTNEITPENLLLWSLRSCIIQRNCIGLNQLIHDWFGEDTNDFIQNAQIIVWANKFGACPNMVFKPFNAETPRPEEKFLFETIKYLKTGNIIMAKNAVQAISGRNHDFAFLSLNKIAQIIAKCDFHLNLSINPSAAA